MSVNVFEFISRLAIAGVFVAASVSAAAAAPRVVYSSGSSADITELIQLVESGYDIKVRYTRSGATFIRTCDSVVATAVVTCFVDNAFDTSKDGDHYMFADPVAFERIILNSDGTRQTIKVDPMGNRLPVSGQQVETVELATDWIVLE